MLKIAPSRRTPAPEPERPPFADPPFWPADLGLPEQVAALERLAPEKARALQTLVETILREVYWQTARTQDGLRTLVSVLTRKEQNR